MVFIWYPPYCTFYIRIHELFLKLTCNTIDWLHNQIHTRYWSSWNYILNHSISSLTRLLPALFFLNEQAEGSNLCLKWHLRVSGERQFLHLCHKRPLGESYIQSTICLKVLVWYPYYMDSLFICLWINIHII